MFKTYLLPLAVILLLWSDTTNGTSICFIVNLLLRGVSPRGIAE